jgi:hypothetical protein
MLTLFRLKTTYMKSLSARNTSCAMLVTRNLYTHICIIYIVYAHIVSCADDMREELERMNDAGDKKPYTHICV